MAQATKTVTRASQVNKTSKKRFKEQNKPKPVSAKEKVKMMTSLDKNRAIIKHIRYADKKIRRRYNWLKYQNAIGLGFFLGSIAGMIISSVAWINGAYPFWLMVLTNAVLASFLHELEHDLIHSLYFKDTWIETMMMWGVWAFRGNTPSSFYRKKIHLLHHKVSGQVTDIEEQMIGNGLKQGFRRMLVMLDQGLAFLLIGPKVARTAPALSLVEMFLSSFPFLAIYTLVMHFSIAGGIILLLQNQGFAIELPVWLEKTFQGAFIAAAVWALPNFIRQGSLQIISSNMHYFGDIKPGREGLLEQCQVLQPWYLVPLQVFCFNFGSTHGIHHFVINQPFYLRQMIAAKAHIAMKRYGVRFNDTKSIFRANRYHTQSVSQV